jgi:LuxR family maltose regulon positive regulatory protein
MVEALCLTQLAVAALEDDDSQEAARLTARALDCLPERTPPLTCAVSALAWSEAGDVARARSHAAEARRRLARRGEGAPWYEAEARILLARALLRLSDAESARRLLSDTSRALRRTPDAVVLRRWTEDAWARADMFAVGAVVGPANLTTAELRVLRFLPSHLSFREVGARLHISANTVKTQAHAVYRKLGASSRSEAVARAREVGLVDT